jgi:hypothetical protein
MREYISCARMHLCDPMLLEAPVSPRSKDVRGVTMRRVLQKVTAAVLGCLCAAAAASGQGAADTGQGFQYPRPTGREGVEVWCHITFSAVRSDTLIAHVVGHDEYDVGFSLEGLVCRACIEHAGQRAARDSYPRRSSEELTARL